MTSELQDKLIASFSRELRPLNTSPLYEWLHANVDLPNVYNPSGTFNVDNYPYLRRPMEDLVGDDIRVVMAVACTQAGKSMLQQLFLPYIALENPGPTLMIFDTGDNAKKVAEERIIPLFENNKDIKRMLDSQKFSARTSGIRLPHMKLRMSGPAESNILGFSARFILGDEVWRWQADGHHDVIEKLNARQTTYNKIKKNIYSSQPDVEGSELHKECMKGQWWEYGYRCPACGILQRYEWNGEKDGKYFGIVMDPTETDEENIKNYDKKASSARLVCQHCFHEITDTDVNRRALITDGDYIRVHSGPDTSIHVYSWNQFVNKDIPFKQMAIQYFDAVLQKRNEGLRTKHQLFTQTIMGRFWKLDLYDETPHLYTEAYTSSEEWSEETIRFLVMDPQRDYINWLIRAWSNKVPESRLIDWGVVAGFGEIENIINTYKISPLCIGIDSGNATRDCYKESIHMGKVFTPKNGKRFLAQWLCLRGDGGASPVSPRKFYKHTYMENGRKIEIDRLYTPVSLVDAQWPANSKYKSCKAHLVTWSNFSIKSILQKLRDKQLPFNWKLNETANADYVAQMFSEELSKKTGRYEKIREKNHVWDLECMQLVLSLKWGCYCPSAADMDELVQTSSQ